VKLFIFWEYDQKRSNWLIHFETPAAFEPLPQYKRFICKKCGKFSHDEVFKEGFPGDVDLRVKGDIFASDDGFLCFNNRVLGVMNACKFPGIVTKPLGKSGWHVVNISLRLGTTPDIFRVIKGPCSECGRLREVIGGVDHLGQLASLPNAECFFSTIADRDATGLADRNLFVTGGIVDAFKANRIKGGVFHLLKDPKTFHLESAAWQRGERIKRPKGDYVIL